MSLELLARAQACEKTVKEYGDCAMQFGVKDCARMTARHVRNMGYKKFLISKVPRYSDAKGAIRAINKIGFDSLEALIDRHFERIAPATAIMGDIVAVQSEYDGLPAMALRLDSDNYFHALSGGFAISKFDMAKVSLAWRVPCLIEAVNDFVV